MTMYALSHERGISMIKLLATDLDGTLLPTGTEVSMENIEAARKAAEAGCVVTIATGRMYKAALPVARNLGIDVPIITYNGALIRTVGGKTLHASYLSPELIREFVDFMEERNWYMQGYAGDELYFAEHDRFARRYEEMQQVTGHAVGWQGLREQTAEVCKLLAISDTPEETEYKLKALQEHFKGRAAVVRSSAYYVEFVNPGVSKADGIRKLAEILGIDISETMAIGDGENDISMLKAVGVPVAMGNAVPEVKEICKYQTGVCEENGWARAVNKYVLQGGGN